ncbi:MAG: hypothetical protein HYX55_11780 [Chloroflexi bacterium]|nr:hypothetical protein [Chloroflexota bacterium]
MRSHPAAAIVLVAVIIAACGPAAIAVSSIAPSASPMAPTPTAPAPATAVYACGSRTLTWDGKSAIDLTGTWTVDDDGVYYLRQLGDQVWWLGMSGLGRPLVDRGSDWTNVYRGTLSGDTITGTYADVPQGKIMDNGPVVLKLTPTAGGGIQLVRTDPILATGFGGMLFTPCKLG